jgi:2'-5' RNA ligase
MTPVTPCQEGGQPGYKWGEEGNVCYPYEAGNEASRQRAYDKAAQQGRAIHARGEGTAEPLEELQEEPPPAYAMVALIPSAEIADALALDIPGAEPTSRMHVTIVYLGPDATLQLDRPTVEVVVADVASRFGPVSGIFNGSAVFGPDEDGRYPVAATLDAPGLGALREALAAALHEQLAFPEDTHGFVAHLTRALAAAPPADLPPPPMLEATFDKLAVCWGDYVANPAGLTMIPLGSPIVAAAPATRTDPDPPPGFGDRIMARGGYSDTPEGEEFRRIVEAEEPVWPSIELVDSVTMYEDREDGSEIEVCIGAIGKTVALTTQAQDGTWIEPDGDGWKACLVVNGKETRDSDMHRQPFVTGWYVPQAIGYWTGGGNGHENAILGGKIEEIWAEAATIAEPAPEAVTAAGGPVHPSRAWFEDPELEDLTPPTATPEGRVFGHIAGLTCHRGLRGCVTVPTKTSYYKFNEGNGSGLLTADGSVVKVGTITLVGGHADMFDARGRPVDPVAVRRHYDDANAVVAYVRAGESRIASGEVVPWFAGSLVPTATEEQVQLFRALTVSGDWRTEAGVRMLEAVLSVPVPGFPPIRQKQLVASGVVVAEITTGPAPEEDDMDESTLAELHRKWHEAVEHPSSVAELVETETPEGDEEPLVPNSESFSVLHEAEHTRLAELEATARRDTAFAAYLQGNVDPLIEWACSDGMTECIQSLTGKEGITDPAQTCNWLRNQGGCLETEAPQLEAEPAVLQEDQVPAELVATYQGGDPAPLLAWLYAPESGIDWTSETAVDMCSATLSGSLADPGAFCTFAAEHYSVPELPEVPELPMVEVVAAGIAADALRAKMHAPDVALLRAKIKAGT